MDSDHFLLTVGTQDFTEGTGAFFEKREAVFHGKLTPAPKKAGVLTKIGCEKKLIDLQKDRLPLLPLQPTV